MKYLIWFLCIASFTSIGLGFAITDSDTIDPIMKAEEMAMSEKLIGFGVLGLFLIVFPLFSYYRWKDKKMADYMLTAENLDKMREYNEAKD
tara:strand:+ start:357 stop:629 length:273 start_codon:yes stop_codon:yes gene_type:complete